MARNLRCLTMLTVAILFLLLVHGIVGNTKDGSDGNKPRSKRNQPKIKCAFRTPINGQVKEVQEDRYEFTCNKGFKLYGQKKSRCVSGNLNNEPPVCTAQGCPAIHLNKNLNMTEPKGYKGRVAEFFCLPGYTLKGQDRIHCNGEGRWSKGPPQCIEDPTTSPTPPKPTDIIKPSSGILVTLPTPPRESPTIFSSRWTTIPSSVQSSAVDITTSLPTSAPDTYATTTAGFDDIITSSISTENKALQSSAVTEASSESAKKPTTVEMQEDTEQETMEDDSLSTFDQSTKIKVTTQIDDDMGVSRSEISSKSDETTVLLTSPATSTEMDEPGSTIEKLPSSCARGDVFPPIDILGHTDAVTSKEVEMRETTALKIDDRMTEVEQVKIEPLNVIASTVAYSGQDKITPEPLEGTVQDGDGEKDTPHVTDIKGSTIRPIFKTASRSSQESKNENPDHQVTVVLIVLAVIAGCVLLALVIYVVAIKVNAYRSQDRAQDEQAAVAYERGLNGSSAVNGTDDNCQITPL